MLRDVSRSFPARRLFQGVRHNDNNFRGVYGAVSLPYISTKPFLASDLVNVLTLIAILSLLY